MNGGLPDRTAEHTVTSLKGFFKHRVEAGEDPTTCMQAFLAFLESNKDRNPQFFSGIASRIDSSFFAPLNKMNQIASPDDFVQTYHNLVNRLLEIAPGMPYKADYQMQRAEIAKAEDLLRDTLAKEKQDKQRIVRDTYNRMLSERREHYTENQGRSLLKTLTCCYASAGVLFATYAFYDHSSEGWKIALFCICIALCMNTALLIGRAFNQDTGTMLMLGLLVGSLLGLAIMFLGERGYAVLLSAVAVLAISGTIALIFRQSRLATIRLTPQEQYDWNNSLSNIEKHFFDKGTWEISNSTLKILTAED